MRFKTIIVPADHGEETVTLTEGLAQALGLYPADRAQDTRRHAVPLALFLSAMLLEQERSDRDLPPLMQGELPDVEVYRGERRVLISLELGERPEIGPWRGSLHDHPEVLARARALLSSVFLLGDLGISAEERMRELRGEREPE